MVPEQYRARKAPFRQRPEWQLSDADVVAMSKNLDMHKVEQAAPADLAALAETLVPRLGRWPRQSKHSHPVECRLHAVLHAAMAIPVATSKTFFTRAGSKARISQVWHKFRTAMPSGVLPPAPSTDWLQQARDHLQRLGLLHIA